MFFPVDTTFTALATAVAAALAFWAVGWAGDVKTTAVGIARCGIGLEKNPIARTLFHRFGARAGFAIFGLVELAIVATFAIAALAAAAGDVDVVGYVTALSSIVVGGLGHLLAAYGNARGRIVGVLVPVLRFYGVIDDAFFRGRAARPRLAPARRITVADRRL